MFSHIFRNLSRWAAKIQLIEHTNDVVQFDLGQGSPKLVRIRREETVLELAQANNIEVSTSCGGMGTCGTCRVHVIEGESLVGDRNEIESEFATERGFSRNERLACQLIPRNGLKIRVAKTKSS